MKQHRYEGRFILANGTPRAFRVWAYNKADAAAAVLRQFTEQVPAADRIGALSYGVERL